MQLTSKQKKYLKGLAHDLQPVVYIGQNGVSDSVLMEIDRTLDSHELIKIRIRCDDHHEMKALTEEIENQSDGNLVQIIGHTMVLYRRAKEPQIVLPR